MPRGLLVLRYTLLQLPGYAMLILLLILLKRIVDFPEYIIWGALGLWVVKDIVLFPFVGRYYDPGYPKDWFSMIGQQGVVHKTLAPNGCVRIKGELWRAEALDADIAISTGQSVVVRKLRGLTLQVVPQNSND